MRTLNSRVVFVDEMALDQLDGETRLADTTTADHDQLVFSRKLQTALVASRTIKRCAQTRQTFEAIVVVLMCWLY